MASEPVILYENLRSCGYTPFYLAQRAGLFEAEGLEVDLRLSPAPPETARGLIEGRADVSFGGPMRVMMHHDAARASGEASPLVCFAQIVARDPFVLVGRAPNPDFRFADLVGPRVGVATDVPTPWMLLYDDLDRAGIDPAALTRAPDAPMAENAAALKRGEIDVAQLYEPHAEGLVSGGHGHVWHRFSARGDIAYTTFYTTRRFAAERREACMALARAMAAGAGGLPAAPGRAPRGTVRGAGRRGGGAPRAPPAAPPRRNRRPGRPGILPRASRGAPGAHRRAVSRGRALAARDRAARRVLCPSQGGAAGRRADLLRRAL